MRLKLQHFEKFGSELNEAIKAMGNFECKCMICTDLKPLLKKKISIFKNGKMYTNYEHLGWFSY